MKKVKHSFLFIICLLYVVNTVAMPEWLWSNATFMFKKQSDAPMTIGVNFSTEKNDINNSIKTILSDRDWNAFFIKTAVIISLFTLAFWIDYKPQKETLDDVFYADDQEIDDSLGCFHKDKDIQDVILDAFDEDMVAMNELKFANPSNPGSTFQF